MKAGFFKIDITPKLGTCKGGWMEMLYAGIILDKLYARVAIFKIVDEEIAFIQLDLLSIRWSDVSAIRSMIEKKYGFPGTNIMISATHNHAGPANAANPPVPRQEEYLSGLKEKCVEAFGKGSVNK